MVGWSGRGLPAGMVTRLCALAAWSYGFAATPVHAGETVVKGPVTSAYTKIEFDSMCVTLSTYEAGGSFACQGYRGFPVMIAHGDLRESAFFGHLGTWFNGADGSQAFVSFSPFNSLQPTVEWRLDAQGVPFAAIARWSVAAPGGAEGPDASVLVVSRVGQPSDGNACVVGYINASATPDANTLARQIADTMAAGFACRDAEPQWHGLAQGPQPDVTAYFPEQN
jgi:hypothetical protein